MSSVVMQQEEKNRLINDSAERESSLALRVDFFFFFFSFCRLFTANVARSHVPLPRAEQTRTHVILAFWLRKASPLAMK